MRKFHTVIIGGGPGGLACATRLAEYGVDVLLLERHEHIGPKVCAGGVPWSGLGQYLPASLLEKSFYEQHIKTNWQQAILRSDKPIISTVDRGKLGQWMFARAEKAGARVETNIPVIAVNRHSIQTKQEKICFKYLVGADGSSSLVRRFLGLPVERFGIGINVFLPEQLNYMEWHLNTKLFRTGYAWIFPHAQTTSVGAYVYRRSMTARSLQDSFFRWLDQIGYAKKNIKTHAYLINFDYRDLYFDNIFLVGDAAGLASGLTGEGIYPAIVSGLTVADSILGKTGQDEHLNKLIKKHAQHAKILDIAAKSKFGCTIIMEALVVALRNNFLSFDALEMGDKEILEGVLV